MKHLLLVLLAACAAHPPGPLAGVRERTMEQLTAPPLLPMLLDAVGLGSTEQLPLARSIFGDKSCHWPGGVLPYIWPEKPGPRVGQPWRCEFTLTCSPPYPDWEAWLLVSFRPAAPIDFSAWTQGCMLVVNPDNIVSTRTSGGMLTREGGRIRMTWTPAPGWAGASMFMQLVVLHPSGSWGLSPGMELIVGSEATGLVAPTTRAPWELDAEGGRM